MILHGPGSWWRRQTLQSRIALVTTALFAAAVSAGGIFLLILLKSSLITALDSSADRAGRNVKVLVESKALPNTIVINESGIEQIQVVNSVDAVIARSREADLFVPVIDPAELARARAGARLEVPGARIGTDQRIRVTAIPAGEFTVLVVTGLGSVDESTRIMTRVALVGGPLAVLALAGAAYLVVATALRPVAELTAGANAITAAGLAEQRLPTPNAEDEIHRLAVTLNAMLDRLDAATTRQRTFVGDAAHELRSPLASLRLQLEVAERLGPGTNWTDVVTDALVDIDRLDRLVDDLLALARLDESGGGLRHAEPVQLDSLVTTALSGYTHARVPVHAELAPLTVRGDPDGLYRVVVNLLDNAMRHANSSVSVVVSDAGQAGGQRSAQIIVADDGPGIAAADRIRVFDRFYRGDESRSRESGGTGLGLAIVSDLVRAHGGTVRLTDSSVDPQRRGLRAVVTLPMS